MPDIKYWSPDENDPAARTFVFEQVLESYPELPYFLRIGRINTRSFWAYDEHLHARDHEVIVIHSGRVRVRIDDRDFIAGPGDAYFVLPGQRHREQSIGPGLKFTFMNFALWNSQGPTGRLAEPPAEIRRQRLRDTDGILAAAQKTITHEVKHPREGSFEVVNALLLQMIWHIRRRLKIARPTPTPSSITSRQFQIVRQARHYIQQQVAEPIRLTLLARHCGVSPDYLWHLFKKAENLTPLQFALKIRMAKAARLLRETEQTSRQIAQQLGFRDPAYFSRAFTRQTGFTPGQYRRQRGAALPETTTSGTRA